MMIRQKMVALALAAALFATPAYADGQMKHHGNWGDGPKQGCMLSGLHAKLFHAAMKKAFDENKPLMEQAKALHKKLDAVVKAKKFDSKAFLSLSSQMGALHDKMMQNHAKAFASVAAKLTPEERQKLADFHPPMNGHMHGDMHDKDGWGKKHGCPMMGKGGMHDGGQKDWFSHLNQ